MGQYLDTDDILGASAEEKDVTIERLGGDVRIRELTREKQLELRKRCTKDGQIDSDLFEMEMIKLCVVDPDLSDLDMEQYNQLPAGIMTTLQNEILELSGLREEALKNAEKRFRSGS